MLTSSISTPDGPLAAARKLTTPKRSTYIYEAAWRRCDIPQQNRETNLESAEERSNGAFI